LQKRGLGQSWNGKEQNSSKKKSHKKEHIGKKNARKSLVEEGGPQVFTGVKII